MCKFWYKQKKLVETARFLGFLVFFFLFSFGCNQGYTAQVPTPEQTDQWVDVATNVPTQIVNEFDGERAYQDVIKQIEFGPRIPGSEGHTKTVEWIAAVLSESGWMVDVQETTMMNHPIRNVIGKRDHSGGENQPWIILGAHYDTRIYADHDPDPTNHGLPVPGANDGASGVAVLLELARSLPTDLGPDVWLVFFDAEDNGRIPDWDWILGSRAFVELMVGTPDAVVIVDMIGDSDLNIHYEKNSDPELSRIIWKQAEALGYGWAFIPEPRFRILDDHIPFLEAGIRAVDLIDFDYEYYHTIADTPDKVSANSLKVVGDTLWHWLQSDSLLE
jgi:glutaminyl-peptide cyclotransferase